MRTRQALKKHLLPELPHDKSTFDIDQDDSDSSYQESKMSSDWNQQMLSINFTPAIILGRDQEKESIFKFIKDCSNNKVNSKVLYISGVPGVGKTAVVKQVLSQISSETKPGKFQFHYINCLTLSKPVDVYKCMYQCLQLQKSKSSKVGQNIAAIEKLLSLAKCLHVFTLDEVDFLVTKNQEILYNLFQWASQSTYQLCLIIIANTMDFPEQLFQKISSRMGNHRLIFKPYNSAQVQCVVSQRLINCKEFQPNAILFASKKLCSFSSDIRTILQVLEKAYRKRKGKVTIEDIAEVWENDIDHKENIESFPKMYRQVIELLCQKKNNSIQLFGIIQQRSQIQSHYFQSILKEMQEMGLIKLTRIHEGAFSMFSVTLTSDHDFQ